MTHKDIYTKFMIEYDKANVTSSYPSLTEYEVATVLDKAYNALIAQKVTGNNVRRVSLEGDLKNISDLSPLIKNDTKTLNKITDTNIANCELPDDMLYYVSGKLTQTVSTPMDGITKRALPVKLVNHQIADKFIVSAYNLPWIKTPVCYIEEGEINIVYDSINKPELDDPYYVELTYVKTPNKFAKELTQEGFGMEDYEWNAVRKLSYFEYENDSEQLSSGQKLQKAYTFECNDTVAEELISLAVAFALENVESQRLNSKLNMRGLEA